MGILEPGRTTTTSSIMYDIIRKFTSGKKINLSLKDESKLQVESEKSLFNLNCINASEFPLTDENFNQNKIYLTAAATDSHRMSISKVRLENKIEFEPII